MAGLTLDDLPAPTADKSNILTVDDLPAPPPGHAERFVRGLKDVKEGAVQLGGRAIDRSLDLLSSGKISDPQIDPKTHVDLKSYLDKDKAENLKAIQDYEQRRGPDAGMDAYRIGGQIVGTAPLMAIPGIGEGYGAAAAGGALSGAVGGAVTAEGEGKDPLTGALTGAATGGGFSVLGKAISNGVKGLIAHISGKFPGSIQDAATQKVLERIAADQKAGGPSAQDAIDAVNAARAAGKPMSLADVGGENVRGLAGYVARQPGEARGIATKALTDRDVGAGIRIAGDIDQSIGKGNAADTAHALMDARSTAAKPLYEEAFAANPSIASKNIDAILETPAGKKALSDASIKMQNDQTLVGAPDKDAAAQMREAGQAVPRDGVASGLNLRTLDYVKRALDDQIGAAKRTGANDDARVLTGLKQKFVAELDKSDKTGKYAAARASYAGPSQSLEALENGGSILRKTPAEVQEEMKGLNDSDKEFYRLGAANALKTVVAKTGASGDEARRIVGNDYVRQQLRPLFDSDSEFNRFVESVGHETKMFQTARQVLGGSQTAARQAEDQSGDISSMVAAGRGLGHLSHGNVLAAAMEALKVKRDLGLRSNPELNAGIAKILFDQGPSQMPGLSVGGSAQPSGIESTLGRLVESSAPVTGGLSSDALQSPTSQP